MAKQPKLEDTQEVVTLDLCNQRGRKQWIAIFSSAIAVLGVASTFLLYGLSECSDAVEHAHSAEKTVIEAVSTLKTDTEKTVNVIATEFASHQAAQNETMVRIDGTLGRIEGALKEQKVELKEQRTMIQEILTNGGH